ncbi:hypothetical protein CKO23_04410 [Thiocystis violacea]|nr:hypothetical protein [Thiocystis violacea]
MLSGSRSHAHLVEVAYLLTACPEPNDTIEPNDTMFLARADTTQAELIGSSAPHSTHRHPSPMMPPAAFLARIR